MNRFAVVGLVFFALVALASAEKKSKSEKQQVRAAAKWIRQRVSLVDWGRKMPDADAGKPVPKPAPRRGGGMDRLADPEPRDGALPGGEQGSPLRAGLLHAGLLGGRKLPKARKPPPAVRLPVKQNRPAPLAPDPDHGSGLDALPSQARKFRRTA